MTSLVTPDEVKAVLAVGITGTALQAVIDREEGWLANDPHVGIGPLSGERTQSIRVIYGDDSPLLLQRPTASVAVTDGGTLLTAEQVVQTGPARIEKVAELWRGPVVAVKYTPNDSAAVKGVVIQLVALALSASPFQQESAQGHQYIRDSGGVVKLRQTLARSLHPHTGLMSTQLRQADNSGRLTDTSNWG